MENVKILLRWFILKLALAAVKRELEQGPAAEIRAVERLQGLLGREGAFVDLNAALCEGLADGSIDGADPAVLAHLKASIIDQVRIDQPQYSGLRTLTEGS